MPHTHRTPSKSISVRTRKMSFSWWLAAILTCKSLVILRKRCERLQLVEEREKRGKREEENKRKRKKRKREEEEKIKFPLQKISKLQKSTGRIVTS